MQKLNAKRRKSLLEFAEKLHIRFRNLLLLNQAMTHSSYANEMASHFHQKCEHNERLEFLGDAVLELATSTYLYAHFPEMPEGGLTKARSSVVCESALYRRALEVDLGKYLLLGKGERSSSGEQRPSVLADAFEAVIGALYLDQGWIVARDYVLNQLHDELLEIDVGLNIKDFKTTLQEIIQRHPGQKISYELLSASGPDHAKTFKVVVQINGLARGFGIGRTKKAAQQMAAKQAIESLQKNYPEETEL